jgi:Undecaprenyl-phosphate galactose phosphotransferase WbaP
MSALLVLAADVAGLVLVLRGLLGDKLILHHSGGELRLWPLLILFLLLYWVCGLYPGITISPVDDLKRISIANAAAFSFISLLLMLQRAPLASLLLCAAACVGASAALPTMRSAVRKAGSRFGWWGYPVAVLGGGDVAVSVLCKLKANPQLGLRPVALVTNRVFERQIEGVSVYGIEHLDQIADGGVKHALVAAPELSQSQLAEVLEWGGDAFPHLIVIPDANAVWKAGSYACDLMGMLGLQVRNNLLRAEWRVAKRAIDLALCAMMAPVLLPLMAVIAAVIAAESGFPVFYSQKRLGHDGRVFRIWKFRTMVRHAAEVLADTLAANPELNKEWLENQKLRNDPRITRIGKVLRKTSLDELPQLWNVIKGEMSLVGPRPIVHEEVAKYKEAYSWYVKTTPGLTGLWQVSGRNQTTYAERVAYDAYYVRNWSVWLDLYLLAKTVTVIFTGYGAY